MFFGHISQVDEKLYPEALRVALNYLKNTDFEALPLGRYRIKGDDIFVQVLDVETKKREEILPEIHHKYIDVQYLHKGSEIIGYAPDFGENQIAVPYEENRDIMFYRQAKGESLMVMQEGSFAIFFPNEIHRPAITLNREQIIRKIVVKVAVSELGVSS